MAPFNRRGAAYQHGHLFSSEIRRKLDAYTEQLITEDKDASLYVQAEKMILKEKITHYNAKVNPSKDYNRGRLPKSSKARELTYDMADEFMNATGLTPKQFLELCMIENEGLMDFNDPEWVEFTWATPEMAKLCVWLDFLTPDERALVRDFIIDLLPASYYDFMDRLHEYSGEYGDDIKYGPEWVKSRDDPEKEFIRLYNLSDRVAQTLWFINGGKSEYPNEIAAKKAHKLRWQDPNDSKEVYTVKMDFQRLARPLHFWGLFNFRDVHLLCDIFQLSPHWVFYGTKEGTVLAKNFETEKIMDLYTFLPDAAKPSVLEYALALRKRGLL